jgi:DNA-binding response OmpR family regulator
MAEQTILVADDDPTYLDLISALLADEGYQAVRCIVGVAAFDEIRNAEPDLVLLDLHSGQPPSAWHTLDLLRIHPATAKIPVIICSTDARLLKEKAERLRTLHCDTLAKPFDLELLLAKIRAAVGPPLQPVTD